MYLIGYDIGGTKIEAMLLHFGDMPTSQKYLQQFEFQKNDHDILPCYVIDKKRVATERHLGYNQIIDKMAHLCHNICNENNIKLNMLSGVGLSVPGPVDPASEIVLVSNSMVVAGHKLHRDLQDKLNITCLFISENDADCFALAEVFCGAGLEYYKQTNIPVSQQTAMGLILGSGFGGGIVVNGRVLTGRRGGGGEAGHVTLYPFGHPCYCGRQGCAEQYLSGPALEAALNSRIYSQIEKRLNCSEIFQLYAMQDPIALAVIKQYKKDLAFYLGNLTNLIDPHYFVLGGGLSLQELIYENLEDQIAQNTFLPSTTAKIFKHKIGDSAGAIGAALVVLSRLNTPTQ